MMCILLVFGMEICTALGMGCVLVVKMDPVLTEICVSHWRHRVKHLFKIAPVFQMCPTLQMLKCTCCRYVVENGM